MFSDHYNVHVNIITYQDVGVSAQAGAVYIMEFKKPPQRFVRLLLQQKKRFTVLTTFPKLVLQRL